MRTALIVLALLAAPAFAAQTVWKWVDDKGVTHYSDQPGPNAQRVEMSSGSRADPVAARPSTYSQRSPNEQTAAEPYRNFEILSPGDQETFVNAGGAVSVRIRFEPGLQAGHSLFLYLDGKRLDDFPPTALDYSLQSVSRGSHTLTAIIQDSRGTRIQSAEVTFHVRQESVAQPPVGPSLRPPPRPRNR
jgi:Domain of unknown function (DUF4124)